MLGGVAAALQWVAAVPTSPILNKNYCTAAAVEVEKESRSAGRVKIRCYVFEECITHRSLTKLIANNIGRIYFSWTETKLCHTCCCWLLTVVVGGFLLFVV
jgi:Leu/Phe-tRNA-protein transferase